MGDKSQFRPKSEGKVSASKRRNVRELPGVDLLGQQASQMSHSLFVAQRSSTLSMTDQQRPSTRYSVRLSNPRISQIKSDRLFHLGLNTDNIKTPEQFGDVKFVVIGESGAEMEGFTRLLGDFGASESLVNLARGGDTTFKMYKVDNTLVVSHSMGSPSISTLLNELIKLMHHAHCNGTTFIRIGQSGGVGVRPGSVIITEQVFDARLRNSHEVVVLGKPQLWPAKLNGEVAKDLMEVNRPSQDGFEAISGNTMSTNDFYEGQFRLNGAFAEYSEVDKQVFLAQLVEKGIMNVEMESSAFAALTHKANIRSAIICVTNLNRLNGDAITATRDQLHAWYKRPQKLVCRYIQQSWNLRSSTTKVNFSDNSKSP